MTIAGDQLDQWLDVFAASDGKPRPKPSPKPRYVGRHRARVQR